MYEDNKPKKFSDEEFVASRDFVINAITKPAIALVPETEKLIPLTT